MDWRKQKNVLHILDICFRICRNLNNVIEIIKLIGSPMYKTYAQNKID